MAGPGVSVSDPVREAIGEHTEPGGRTRHFMSG
jgi:hypothetical protein